MISIDRLADQQYNSGALIAKVEPSELSETEGGLTFTQQFDTNYIPVRIVKIFEERPTATAELTEDVKVDRGQPPLGDAVSVGEIVFIKSRMTDNHADEEFYSTPLVDENGKALFYAHRYDVRAAIKLK